LLRHHAVRFEERGGYISALHAKVFWEPHQANVEAYMDDIVVKSKQANQLVADLD
jgi:hypothetical protein